MAQNSESPIPSRGTLTGRSSFFFSSLSCSSSLVLILFSFVSRSNTLFFEDIVNGTDASRTAFFLGGRDAIVHAERVKHYLEHRQFLSSALPRLSRASTDSTPLSSQTVFRRDFTTTLEAHMERRCCEFRLVSVLVVSSSDLLFLLPSQRENTRQSPTVRLFFFSSHICIFELTYSSSLSFEDGSAVKTIRTTEQLRPRLDLSPTLQELSPFFVYFGPLLLCSFLYGPLLLLLLTYLRLFLKRRIMIFPRIETSERKGARISGSDRYKRIQLSRDTDT